MGNDFLSNWFTFLALFNTNLGFTNFEKNKEQENKQNSIEEKIDEILSILRKMEDKNE